MSNKLNKPDNGDHRLGHNILLFARTLRSAGLPVGTSQIIEALLAVAKAGIERRKDFYWSLRAILVKKPSQLQIFNQAFHLYFRNPRLLERLMALFMPRVVRDEPDKSPEQAIRRLLEAISIDQDDIDDQPRDQLQTELDQSNSYSDRELFRRRDFEQMTLAEQGEAGRILTDDLATLQPRPTRRFRPDSRGERVDLRRSLRLMARGSGHYIPLARKQRVKRSPDLVLICDISGSMSSYSRVFLHFAHALTRKLPVVHSFVFGTRLTAVSHRLDSTDVDEALQLVAADVDDWDGGTRIAQCLRDFNLRWSRRVLARDSIVIMLSDGLERDAESDLEFQMRRLQRSCRNLIWMNPMLRYEQFEAKASGIKKMLPYVDLFVPAHNIQSLTALWQALCTKADSPARSSRLLPGTA